MAAAFKEHKIMKSNFALLLSLITFGFVTACATEPVQGPGLGTANAGLSSEVPTDFSTIQAAINAADEGDTITILSGNYTENLNIEKDLVLVGPGVDSTVIFGTINVSLGAHADIAGLTLDGSLSSTNSVGIHAIDSQITLNNMEVRNFNEGVVITELLGSVGASSVNTTVIDGCAATGLRLVDVAAGFTLTNSILQFNSGHGLWIDWILSTIIPEDTVLAHNLFFANGYGYGSAAGVRSTGSNVKLVNSIVTSNNVGVSCSGCPASQCIVWGNITNYDGGFAGPGTIQKDPRFTAAASGDFTLLFDSPAIDAGSDGYSIAKDMAGTERPQGLKPDIGPYEFALPSTTVLLAITEVMANPVFEGTGEYIEIYNYGTESVDLEDFQLTDGDQTDLITGFEGGATILEPNAYALILDPDYAGDYEIPLGTLWLTVSDDKTLGSGISTSDPIRIFLANGTTLIDSYSFPFNPGNGLSVEKQNIEDGDIAGNWVTSPCGESPGEDNCANLPPNLSAQILIAINEVMANPLVETTGEFVELYNFSGAGIDVGGMVLADGDTTDTITGYNSNNTVIPAGHFGVILDPDYADQYLIPDDAVLLTVSESTTLGNGLAVNDPISLIDGVTGVIIDTYTHNFNPGNGISTEKVDYSIGDIPSNYVSSTCGDGASPGSINCVLVDGASPIAGATLSIMEVMANPLDEDTGEYIELLNFGFEPIDLAGFRISDGDQEDRLQAFEGSATVLAPGALALIVDAEYAGQYPVPGDVILLTTHDTTVGGGLSTNDPIRLRAPKGAKAIDTFSSPFNPGNGISIEKIDLLIGDVSENWIDSPCIASPGTENCSSAGVPESDLGTTGLTISEVMANPYDEVKREYVEIFNAGSVGVDLSGWNISDGDSIDAIVGWNGGSAFVPAGSFAVILDPDYQGGYSIPSEAVRLTVGDSTIGNGLSTTDTLKLLKPDGINVVSTFSFPFNAGNGKAIERVTLTTGDVQANWDVSTCDKDAGDGNDFASPGERNCIDPYGGLTGTKPMGQACPFGSADCLSGLCAVDLLTFETFCTADCSLETCSEGFQCSPTLDVNYDALCTPVGGTTPNVVINEVLYDSVGSDTNVFVELYGPPGAILDGLTLVGINGNGGKIYRTVALTGIIPDDGFFVVAHPDAESNVVAEADQISTKADFQNGPDTLQIRMGNDLLDSLGYGDFGGTSVFGGESNPCPDVETNSGLSIGRLLDGGDSDNNADDFGVLASPSPGAPNTGE
jgi:hypothetical protein